MVEGSGGRQVAARIKIGYVEGFSTEDWCPLFLQRLLSSKVENHWERLALHPTQSPEPST